MFGSLRRLFAGSPDKPRQKVRREYIGRDGRGRPVFRDVMLRPRRPIRPQAQEPLVRPMAAIEAAREKADLTVYGLAILSDVDETYLRRLLNGQRRNPSRDTLIFLGEALMQFDDSFKRKHLEKVLKNAGLRPLPRKWTPREIEVRYSPRTQIKDDRGWE